MGGARSPVRVRSGMAGVLMVTRRRHGQEHTMINLTTTSHRQQGIDLEVRRKGRGPSMLVLHGGGGPVLGYPFADRLAEHFELIEPVHPGFADTPIPDHFDGL